MVLVEQQLFSQWVHLSNLEYHSCKPVKKLQNKTSSHRSLRDKSSFNMLTVIREACCSPAAVVSDSVLVAAYWVLLPFRLLVWTRCRLLLQLCKRPSRSVKQSSAEQRRSGSRLCRTVSGVEGRLSPMRCRAPHAASTGHKCTTYCLEAPMLRNGCLYRSMFARSACIPGRMTNASNVLVHGEYCCCGLHVLSRRSCCTSSYFKSCWGMPVFSSFVDTSWAASLTPCHQFAQRMSSWTAVLRGGLKEKSTCLFQRARCTAQG